MKALVAALLAVASCASLKPAEGPGTEYPCGVRAHSCGNGACCWNHEECGGVGPEYRCPPGMCCNLGNVGAKRPQSRADAGADAQ